MPPEEGLPEVGRIKDQPGADQDNDEREEGPGRDQSLHDPDSDRSEDDQNRDWVLECVVSKLKEISTVQIEGFEFCDIPAVLGNHNRSLS